MGLNTANINVFFIQRLQTFFLFLSRFYVFNVFFKYLLNFFLTSMRCYEIATFRDELNTFLILLQFQLVTAGIFDYR